ncbi:hypothetical protein [Mycolicibacterium conceptionense]
MRPFRIFNDVKGVRMVAKIGGVRMGPFAVIAILLLMACSLIVIMAANPLIAAGFFAAGFVLVSVYVAILTRIDSTGVLSELTALSLLRRGLSHRHSANFDLPGI